MILSVSVENVHYDLKITVKLLHPINFINLREDGALSHKSYMPNERIGSLAHDFPFADPQSIKVKG